jgi:hypothetical protein
VAKVTLDQQLRELGLSAREQAAVLFELARARTCRAQLLALGHDAADLGGERLDGVAEAVHAPQATVPPG